MAKTLRIRNTTKEKLPLEVGGKPIELEPEGEIDLDEKQLKSPGFAKVLAEGKLAFAEVDDPDVDQIFLARSVLPPLVAATGSKLESLKLRYQQSVLDLKKQRNSYETEVPRLRAAVNKSRKAADEGLTAAKGGVPGWSAIEDAVTKLLLDTRTEDDVVAAKQKKLDGLKKKLEDVKNADPEEIKDDPEKWYEARRKAAEEVAAAGAELQKALDDAKKTDSLARLASDVTNI